MTDGKSPASSRDRNERAWMRRALVLAERGWGQTAPNPMVGAVVVRDGGIVGKGFHAKFGEPHAEVVALAEAGDRARGATVVVTLEPCNHHGKTPPCVDALIAAGVKRVVCAVRDPGRESGGGADRLRAAGIEVEFGSWARARSPRTERQEAAATGSDAWPWVTLKLCRAASTRRDRGRTGRPALADRRTRAEIRAPPARELRRRRSRDRNGARRRSAAHGASGEAAAHCAAPRRVRPLGAAPAVIPPREDRQAHPDARHD